MKENNNSDGEEMVGVIKANNTAKLALRSEEQAGDGWVKIPDLVLS